MEKEGFSLEPEPIMEIPNEAEQILEKLKKSGFEAYAVGGCVRDLLREVKPKDWDVTTNAEPKEIQKIFPRSFYKNKFGTVTALADSLDPTLREIEITTYRIDEKYSDKRHPDSVKFTKNLKEDLARRDFTINAVAFGLKSQTPNLKSQINSKFKIQNSKFILIDPFDGEKDLKDKIIRAVGNPEERFNEDALRMMRAVRFAADLDFEIEPETLKAIQENAVWLQAISKERIRDEFIKIIVSYNAEGGIKLLKETNLLKYVLPELEEGVKIDQNKHHKFDVFEHLTKSLGYAASQNYSLEVILGALLHDIAKPRTRKWSEKNKDWTFYGHDMDSARLTPGILERLRFSKKIIQKVTLFVKYHLFNSDPEVLSERGLRRFISRVGKENIDDLIKVRTADRIGSGVPKAMPYRLRYFQFLLEKVSREPIFSLKDLKIDGNDVMGTLKIEAGPKIGFVLKALLNEVFEDPSKNKKEYLKKRVKELGVLKEKELEKLVQEARKKELKAEEKDLGEIKKKYWVK